MKTFLIIITSTLLISQTIILTTLNIYDKSYIETSLNIADYKIQSELDHEFERLNDDALFVLGKNIGSRFIEDFDQKLIDSKELIKLESKNTLTEYLSNPVSFIPPAYIELSITKLLNDRLYASKFLKGYLWNSLLNLRNDLNIMLASNILVLSFIMLLLSNEHKMKQGLKISIVALITIIASTLIYYFGQNWIYSILMDSYYGYFYNVLIGCIFLYITDIVFNKGNIVGCFSYYTD